MKLTVDRIEEGTAVLEKEDLTHITVPAQILPQGVKEGSVLIFDGVNYNIDAEAESERRKAMLRKQNLLFKNTKKD
mgnify:CR=1 FL=1